MFRNLRSEICVPKCAFRNVRSHQLIETVVPIANLALSRHKIKPPPQNQQPFSNNYPYPQIHTPNYTPPAPKPPVIHIIGKLFVVTN